MKIMFLILILVLCTSSISANVIIKSSKIINGTKIETVCIDGFLWMLITGPNGDVDSEQLFVVDGVPKTCLNW